MVELAQRYPFIEPPRLTHQAQRLAMIELATEYVDERGICS